MSRGQATTLTGACANVHSQMDQISGLARLQDDVKASFEQATGVIRQLREGNERLRAERDLLREKIVRSADQCLIEEDWHHHQETYGQELHAPHLALVE